MVPPRPTVRKVFSDERSKTEQLEWMRQRDANTKRSDILGVSGDRIHYPAFEEQLIGKIGVDGPFLGTEDVNLGALRFRVVRKRCPGIHVAMDASE